MTAPGCLGLQRLCLKIRHKTLLSFIKVKSNNHKKGDIMKIFVDSADLYEISQAYSWGIADGVTTNPSLLKKAVELRKDRGERVDLNVYIKRLLKMAKGTPVSLEVTEYDAKGMIKQGKALYKKFNPVAKNIYIKVPVNPSFEHADRDFDGIQAIKGLSKAKIPVNCTLIFTAEQALLAAKAGARFVSPFAGRVDDHLRMQYDMKFEKDDYYPMDGLGTRKGLLHDHGILSGVDLVETIVNIFHTHKIKCEVLAASIRNTRQFRECAEVGADIATLPFSVIKELLKHPKTEEGMVGFTRDIVPEYVKLTK